ncbi:hypothetical protein GALMADRAFT_785871 [Galerina marginata CBS 339.88]|uniref:Uncharacterized protein n=1 Tax=Galerina marginata (strain CBS 339.88) TaxID=685588 RepID=A0A067SUN6_GALM3|nr:hypothetical protein GALMADRAFT_785871 [Galerina marginata CBS 339.88]
MSASKWPLILPFNLNLEVRCSTFSIRRFKPNSSESTSFLAYISFWVYSSPSLLLPLTSSSISQWVSRVTRYRHYTSSPVISAHAIARVGLTLK